MGKRRENRSTASMSVLVSGVDNAGNPFSQTARTIDVSQTGAHLAGIHCLRGVGDLVTISHASHSAQFRIIWIGIPGSSEDGHFGVRAVQRDKQIFKINFGPTRPDDYVAPAGKASSPSLMTPSLSRSQPWDGGERRAAHRIHCTGTGQIRQPGVAYPIWTKVTDLSMGGCYLEMIFSLQQASPVEVTLSVNDQTFTASGTVVTSHPGVGVGIRFTRVSEENRNVLTELLQALKT